MVRIGKKAPAKKWSLYQIIGSAGIITGLISMSILGACFATQRTKKKVEVAQIGPAFNEPPPANLFSPLPGEETPVTIPAPIRTTTPAQHKEPKPEVPPATIPKESQSPPAKSPSPPVPKIEEGESFPDAPPPTPVEKKTPATVPEEKKPPISTPKKKEEVEEDTSSQPKPPPTVIGKTDRKDGAEKLPATGERPKDPNIETFGTAIEFMNNLENAYEKATKESKPVLVLRFEGEFENGAFTCESAEILRTKALMDQDVADRVIRNFIPAFQKIPPQTDAKLDKFPIVTTYVCANKGGVLHAIPGGVEAGEFENEMDWILKKREIALKGGLGKDDVKYRNFMRTAHKERFMEQYEIPKFPMIKQGPGNGFGGGVFPPKIGFPPGMPGMQLQFPKQQPINLPAQMQVHWYLATNADKPLSDTHIPIEKINRNHAK
jgi:hypothetical protein